MKVWLVPTLISALIVGLGFSGIWFVASSAPPQESPGLGDWGDAVGALVATVSFIWLIALHIDNSLQIRQNQGEIERTNERVEELLSLLSDMSASLARSAGANKVQAAVEFQRMAPEIVLADSLAGSTGPHTVTGRPHDLRCIFRNDGFRVTLEDVSLLTGDIQVQPLRPLPFEWLRTHAFGVHVIANRPLRDIGPFSFKLRYSQAHGPWGTTIVKFTRFDAEPTILNETTPHQASSNCE